MSRLLAWSFGASVGLVVGFLVGESFRDGLALARLGRPEPRSAVPAPRETPEGLNGQEAGACGDVDLWDGRVCTRPAGHDGDHGDGPNAAWWTSLPTQREGTLDVADLQDRPDYREALARAEGMPWEPGVELGDWERSIAKPAAARRYFYPLAEVASEFGIDLADDEPCTHTLGPLTCPFKGPHTAHAYQSGTWAPDRKQDADEGIE